ncbi:unnamed protein product [Amoebophrya sp. A25]|nr:unnamed protein product [Amoebophrya sp. A25]|eukprot:GSA25T00001984001.1
MLVHLYVLVVDCCTNFFCMSQIDLVSCFQKELFELVEKMMMRTRTVAVSSFPRQSTSDLHRLVLL